MKSYEGIGRITLKINGRDREFIIEPHETLLKVLREKIGLT